MPLDCLDCRGKFGPVLAELRCSLCGQLFRLRQLVLSERFPADGVPVVEPQVKAALFAALEVADSYLSKQKDKGAQKDSSTPGEGSDKQYLLEATPKSKARGADGGARKDSAGTSKDKSLAEEDEKTGSRSSKGHRAKHSRQEEEEERSGSRRRRGTRRSSRHEEDTPKKKEEKRDRGRGDESEESQRRGKKRTKEESEESRSRTSEEQEREERGKKVPRSPSRPPPGREERGSGDKEAKKARRPPIPREAWRGPIFARGNQPRTFRDHPEWDPSIKYTNKGKQKRQNQEARREKKGKGKGSAWRGL